VKHQLGKLQVSVKLETSISEIHIQIQHDCEGNTINVVRLKHIVASETICEPNTVCILCFAFVGILTVMSLLNSDLLCICFVGLHSF